MCARIHIYVHITIGAPYCMQMYNKVFVKYIYYYRITGSYSI